MYMYITCTQHIVYIHSVCVYLTGNTSCLSKRLYVYLYMYMCLHLVLDCLLSTNVREFKILDNY